MIDKDKDTNVNKKTKMSKFANKVDIFILEYTPKPIIKFFDWLVSKLPNKAEKWVRSNRFLTVCIGFTIRGLFFRPSMWLLYASIAAYFGYK